MNLKKFQGQLNAESFIWFQEFFTARLQRLSDLRMKQKFLFLNLQAQQMELLQSCAKGELERMYMDYTNLDVPLVKTDPKCNRHFTNGRFTGNLGRLYELQVLEGSYMERNFEQLEDVYHAIRSRQP